MEKRLFIFENRGAAKFVKRDKKVIRIGRLGLSKDPEGKDLPPAIGPKGFWEQTYDFDTGWADKYWDAFVARILIQEDEITEDVLWVFMERGDPQYEVKPDGSRLCSWRVAFSKDVEGGGLPLWFTHDGPRFAEAMRRKEWDAAKIRKDLEGKGFIWGTFEVHLPAAEKPEPPVVVEPAAPKSSKNKVMQELYEQYKKSPPT